MHEFLGALRPHVYAPEQPAAPSRRNVIAAALAVGLAGIGGFAVLAAFEAPEAPEASVTDRPVNTSTTTSRSTPTPAPCPEVAAIVGDWRFTSYVVWADKASLLAAKGYYSVEVQPEQGCRAVFLVRKRGDSGKDRYGKIYQDRIVAEVQRDTSGAITATLDAWLAADKALDGSETGRRSGLHYRYSLQWRDGRLTGDWEMFHKDTATPEMRGLLAGAPEGVEFAVAEDLEAASCAAQCRIRCPGAIAAERCLARCVGGDVVVRDCGAPDREFRPPTATFQAASEPLGWPPAPSDACLKVAGRLSGRWRVAQGGSAEVVELTLESAACSLSGQRRAADATHAVHGWVDDRGVWRLQAVDRPTEPVWALVGWDPAFGVAEGGGAVLAAQKL